MQIELQERLGAMKGAWPSPCHRPVSRTGAMQTNSLDGQKYSRRHDTWTSVRDALGSEDSPCVRRERTVRNSPRFLWILGRIVRAAYSFLSLATHTGTTLCVSISWKGTSPKFSFTCVRFALFHICPTPLPIPALTGSSHPNTDPPGYILLQKAASHQVLVPSSLFH